MHFLSQKDLRGWQRTYEFNASRGPLVDRADEVDRDDEEYCEVVGETSI